MPVIIQTVTSKVSAMWGRSFIRDPQGKMRLLQMGEVVVRGDVILTEQNAIVQLSELPNPETLAALEPAKPAPPPADMSDMDRVIAGIEAGDKSVVPAAGSSGADGGLQPGTYVERVSEEAAIGGLPPGGPSVVPLAASGGALPPVMPMVVNTGTPVRPSVQQVQPRGIGANADEVLEGTSLVYSVTLSAPTGQPEVYTFALGGGTAAANDFGTPVFSDGVVLNADGTITVPAGVTGFSVTVPTTDDANTEFDETLPLVVDGKSAVGVIVDDDEPPTIRTLEVGDPGVAGDAVVEGTPLVYAATLSHAARTPTVFSFALGGGSASGADHGAPEFSNGVVLNADGTITVPAGVSSFSIIVATEDDAAVEPTETLPLAIGGMRATGEILDNDSAPPPTIDRIEPGAPGIGDDRVPEGTELVYTVTLSSASNSPVSFPYSLGGGTASAGDFGAPVFGQGVLLNADGTISVPPGVTSFTVTVPTTQDTVDEPDETVPLTIGGVTGNGTIVDDDDKPKISTVEPGQPGVGDDAVPEGTNLVYTVTLTGTSSTPQSYPFNLGGGTASPTDYGSPQFSDGVTLNPDGAITVPAGVTSFTVTVPTTQDTTDEPDETVPLTIGGVTGTGTIIDDDGKPRIDTVEPGRPGVGDDAVPEGTNLVYTVTLTGTSAAPQSYPFNLGGGTASPTDYGSPQFSDGVTLNPDGTITVPAGVASFTVTVPTTQDTTDEPDETVPLTIGGVTGTGTIIDDDGKPRIDTVEPGRPGVGDDAVPEGTNLVYTVTLTGTSAAPQSYPFNLGGGTASPTDYGSPQFSDGVTLNPDGTITVPAGVTSFTVTVPTTQDTTDEPDETVPLTIGGVTGTGTIIDDDGKPRIDTVEPGRPGVGDDAVPEGTNLVYTVTLTGTSATPQSYPFNLGGGTASPTDYGSPQFSDGVTLNPDGTITVPAGVTSFTVTVPTTQDTTDEPDETVPLTIGGVTGTGTIIDDDDKPKISTVEPGRPGPGDDAVPEGTNLVYTVTLTGTSATPQSYPFNLGGGTASPTDYGSPQFSNGVTLNPDGTITVPAGVTSFTVTVPTTQDTTDEPDETVPLTIGGVTGTGTIIDDDGKPRIDTVEPGRPGVGDDAVPEGTNLVYTVTLTGTSATPQSYPFNLGGGTASPTDYGSPQFSNGVTLNPDGTITVPAGVTSFTVTVPTTQDTTDEPDETVPLTIGGVTGTGTVIDDDDKPKISTVEPGRPGPGDDAVLEGTNLVYTVTLTGTSAAPQSYPFNLGGGSAGTGDYGNPQFSNGVTLNPDGTITVPAGVTSFTVTVPTTQDTTDEPDETVPLTIGGVTGTGTIIDDDDKPKISTVEPGRPGPGDDAVPEGTNLVYTVTLTGTSATPQSYPFNLGGGSAGTGDYGSPQFSNGVTLNPDGTITVPAGVTSFTVTVPTTQDTTDEPDETVPLTIDGVTGTGTIIDDDDKPRIDTVEPGRPGVGDDAVPEGTNLVYTVTLTGTSAAPQSYAFNLGGGSAGTGDYGNPQFSNGVTLNPDGTITVPAGVASFTVTVPTTQDTTDEPDETVPLTIGGVTGTGTIIDDDDKPKISTVEPGRPGPGDDAVPEGTNLVYTVTLTGTSATPQSYPFNLGGGTASPADYGSPQFSNGVTLNPDGTITVPAGVASFTVTVPTTQDTTDEPDETVPLTIGGVTGTGTIIDDDGKPRIDTVEPGRPGVGDDAVPEGTNLVYTVTLTGTSATPQSYPFNLGGGTASPTDYGSPQFSDGVTLNPDGTITVPAGVTSFTVTVPTTQDTTDEPDETVPLTIGGVTGTGTIIDDDDKPKISTVEPGRPGPGDDAVPEGTNLVYTVTLTGTSATPQSYPFNLGGGSAGTGDYGNPQFSNGVTLNPDGTITVPAGVTSFTVTVPTTQDTTDEPDETVPLTIGGVTGTGAIIDDDDNRPPVVSAATASLSEEGLAGGLRDNLGQPVDTTDAASASGRIQITDPEGQPIGGVVLTAPTQPLTSGGQPVTWSGSGTGLLTATAGGQTVATVSIDATGQYSVRLLKPLDHATADGENLLSLAIGVQASDGQRTGSGVLTLKIEDDAPVAVDTTLSVSTGSTNTNLMVVLDLSGSMGEQSGIGGLNRMQAAVKAIETLIDRYDAQGDVMVRLVTFDTQGQALGERWCSAAAAKTMLAGLSTGNGTNYDDALADAMSAFTSPGKLAGAQNVSYFLSDGEPNKGSGSTSSLTGSLSTGADAGIQADEARQWTGFLTANQVRSYAIGMGTGLGSTAALDPIAFDGRAGTPGQGTVVDDFADLAGVLSQTAAPTVSGQLPRGGGAAGTPGIGADGGHIHSLVVDGTTFTYDPKAQGGQGGVSASSAQAFSFDASTQTLSVRTRAGGEFVIDLDDIAYQYRAPQSATSSFTETLRYTLIDADGDQSTAHLQVQVAATAPVNQAPVVGQGTATVSEEGLAAGLADSLGRPTDSTNSATASGQISISDPEGQPIGNVVLHAPTTALTSGGAAVTWAGSGTSRLTASANGETVATVGIDAAGRYSVNLLKALDHAPGDGENLLNLSVGVSASDGQRTGQGSLNITVEDDAPRVLPAASSVAAVNTNVLVVLDISGSMKESAPGTGLTRLQAAVKAVEALLDRYDAQGDVAVRLVSFSTEGQPLGDGWTSVAQAKQMLAGLSANGWTNYDDALADAMAAFTSPGRLSGAQNVSYFLSDGDPNYGSGSTSSLSGTLSGSADGPDAGIQSAEESTWTTFLDRHGIVSHAVAVGSDISSPAALNPVAYDGVSHTNTAAVVVGSYSQLASTLLQTSGAQTSGRLWAGGGGLGADGGHVRSFEVDGVTYVYDPSGAGRVQASNGQPVSFDAATRTLCVSTCAGGKFFVDMDDGGYCYRGPDGNTAGLTERFRYSVVDRDGDVASASGSVQVGAVAVVEGTAGHDAALRGGSGVDRISGLDGNDMLSGNAGDDVLVGGAGSDTLAGGAGHDQLFGGYGADVFKWSLADRGTPGQPAVDTVGDFDMAPRSAGGDALDLRDLLGGALAGQSPANLHHYLDVDTQSQPGSTVLHVSTSGGFANGVFKPAAEDQRIVLDGVNLRDALSLGESASDNQVLQELLNRQKLDLGS